MAILSDIVMRSNRAFGEIKSLAMQAKSYTSHPNMLRAKGIASSIANGAKTSMGGLKAASRSGSAIGYGLAGAGAGVGYEYMTNDRASRSSMLRAGLRGGAAGYLGGMGAYGIRSAGGFKGLRSMAGSAMGAGTGMGRRGMSAIGNRLKSEWGDISSWAEMYSRDSARFGGAMR